MDVLEKMSTFIRVVEAGSFSAAAKQLRISSAAVSRQIATLEAELEVTLLARTTRRMAITIAGRRYYERCLHILRAVDDAQNASRGDAVSGLLQVNAPITFGLGCVVPYVPSLLAKHPHLRLDLRLEDRLIDLALEGVDVAIRVGSPPPASTDLVAHRLGAFQRVVVAAPRYLKRRGHPKSPEALAKHDALSYAAAVGDEWHLRSAEREARVRMNVTFRCNALHALRDLAVSGAGVALLPEWLVGEEVASGALKRVLGDWKTAPVPVNVMHRTEHRGAPLVRALVAHLRSVEMPVFEPRN